MFQHFSSRSPPPPPTTPTPTPVCPRACMMTNVNLGRLHALAAAERIHAQIESSQRSSYHGNDSLKSDFRNRICMNCHILQRYVLKRAIFWTNRHFFHRIQHFESRYNSAQQHFSPETYHKINGRNLTFQRSDTSCSDAEASDRQKRTGIHWCLALYLPFQPFREQ
jgi:hypothetical protein